MPTPGTFNEKRSASRIRSTAARCRDCRRAVSVICLPSGHGEFDVRPPAGARVSGMSIGEDPLTELVARALAVPLRELYAVLWRAGVLEIDD